MYYIAENDFMVDGGDGYPNFASRAHTREIMDQTVADYITANTPISPGDPGPDRLHDDRGDRLPRGDARRPNQRWTEPLSRSR